MEGNKSLIFEIWDFLKVRKKWWLLPVIILLIMAGALIIFGQKILKITIKSSW